MKQIEKVKTICADALGDKMKTDAAARLVMRLYSLLDRRFIDYCFDQYKTAYWDAETTLGAMVDELFGELSAEEGRKVRAQWEAINRPAAV